VIRHQTTLLRTCEVGRAKALTILVYVGGCRTASLTLEKGLFKNKIKLHRGNSKKLSSMNIELGLLLNKRLDRLLAQHLSAVPAFATTLTSGLQRHRVCSVCPARRFWAGGQHRGGNVESRTRVQARPGSATLKAEVGENCSTFRNNCSTHLPGTLRTVFCASYCQASNLHSAASAPPVKRITLTEACRMTI
jgi:hypothetical protein